MKIRNYLSTIIAAAYIIVSSGCSKTTIDANPNYFINHYAGKIGSTVCFKDTLENKIIYIESNDKLDISRSEKYPGLKGLEIKDTGVKDEEQVSIYKIKKLILED